MKEIEMYRLESGISNKSRGDPTWRMESMQEAIRSTDPIAPSPLPYPRILEKVQQITGVPPTQRPRCGGILGRGRREARCRTRTVDCPPFGWPRAAMWVLVLAGGLAGGESATWRAVAGHGHRRRIANKPCLEQLTSTLQFQAKISW